MILITGATGTVGSAVMKQLSGMGVPLRALVHHPEQHKADALRQMGAEVVGGDLSDEASVEAAMQGVTSAFLLPPVDDNAVMQQQLFADAAHRMGVKHIVKLSVIDADPSSPTAFLRWHGEAEAIIKNSGVAWTFVRANSFYQNMLTMAGSIAGQGAFYLPAQDAKVSHVDVSDIAKVAAKALTEEGHEGKTYTVTGGKALSYSDIAEKIAAATGKPVQYTSISPEDFKNAMLGYGVPANTVDGLNGLYAWYVTGAGAKVSQDMQTVTGSAPKSFDEFAQENAAVFKGA